MFRSSPNCVIHVLRGELQCDANGSIDRVGSTLLAGIGKLPDLEPGAVLEGWALACGRSPAQLLVIDGRGRDWLDHELSTASGRQ